MDDLIINPTRFTPKICFHYSRHILEISGESYPENASEFYGPVFRSLAAYLDSLADQAVTMTLHLTYFNSSSSKILINLFELLEEFAGKGKNIAVNWVCRQGDSDTREFGEEFSEDLESLTFNIVWADGSPE